MKPSFPPQNPFRYVDSSIDALAARLARRAAAPCEVECKVFGGASALFQGEAGVGEQNVRAAFEALARHRFRVAASHCGGEKGRKLVFLSHTGEVFVKLLGVPEHGRKPARLGGIRGRARRSRTRPTGSPGT
jgi:chemotaxis protein CheD